MSLLSLSFNILLTQLMHTILHYTRPPSAKLNFPFFPFSSVSFSPSPFLPSLSLSPSHSHSISACRGYEDCSSCTYAYDGQSCSWCNYEEACVPYATASCGDTDYCLDSSSYSDSMPSFFFLLSLLSLYLFSLSLSSLGGCFIILFPLVFLSFQSSPFYPSTSLPSPPLPFSSMFLYFL